MDDCAAAIASVVSSFYIDWHSNSQRPHFRLRARFLALSRTPMATTMAKSIRSGNPAPAVSTLFQASEELATRSMLPIQYPRNGPKS